MWKITSTGYYLPTDNQLQLLPTLLLKIYLRPTPTTTDPHRPSPTDTPTPNRHRHPTITPPCLLHSCTLLLHRRPLTPAFHLKIMHQHINPPTDLHRPAPTTKLHRQTPTASPTTPWYETRKHGSNGKLIKLTACSKIEHCGRVTEIRTIIGSGWHDGIYYDDCMCCRSCMRGHDCTEPRPRNLKMLRQLR